MKVFVLTSSVLFLQSSEPDSQKKFPSKSCPLRYGTAKIQDDAFNLFHAALREFLGACQTKSQVTLENDWGITGLSVSASKIDCIPVVSVVVASVLSTLAT